MTLPGSFVKVPSVSKPRKENRPFTATEVGTLIESFRSEISVLGEHLGSVTEDVAVLKFDGQSIKADVQLLRDMVRGNSEDIRHLHDMVRGNSEDIQFLKTGMGRIEDLLRTSLTSTNACLTALETKIG